MHHESGDVERANLRFRQVVEAAPKAMVMVNSHGLIELVNTQTELIFGYRRAELLGQTIDILLPERFRHQHPHHRAAFFSDLRPRAMGTGRDLYGRRKDGTEFPVEVGLNPIETDDGVKVLSAITDISARKRMEARFRQWAAGKVIADWPGLSNSQLYQGRDLQPTMALDQVIAELVSAHYFLDNALVSRTLFPATA